MNNMFRPRDGYLIGIGTEIEGHGIVTSAETITYRPDSWDVDQTVITVHYFTVDSDGEEHLLTLTNNETVNARPTN